MVCKYQLKENELHKLIKEEKRSSLLFESSVAGWFVSAITEILRKEKPKTAQEKLTAVGFLLSRH